MEIGNDERRFWLWFKKTTLEVEACALRMYEETNDQTFLAFVKSFAEGVTYANEKLKTLDSTQR